MTRYCYDFPKPSVTTDCIVIRKSDAPEILLIKRKHDPYEGLWALPGGFVEIDEDLEPGAIRELEEETGITGITLTQFKTYGKPGRDPRGRTISIVYYTLVSQHINTQAGDDASETKWFSIDELPNLAFDHDEILSEFFSSDLFQ